MPKTYRGSYPSLDESTPPAPERSPLEPMSSYKRRKNKWRADNAKWQGQRRAVSKLANKPTPIPKPLVE